MRDWRAYVRDHLRLDDIRVQRALDMVDELAVQLEDVYRAALSRGASEQEADAMARGHVEDWDALGDEIRIAAPSARLGPASEWADRADARARAAGPAGTWLADLGMDVRYALRTLRRSPAFTGAVVLLVGIGVGLNTAVFSALKEVYLKQLPFPEPRRLAVLWNTSTRGGRGPVSWPDYQDWKAQNQSFTALGLMRDVGVNLADEEVPQRAQGAYVTSSIFDVFDVRPVLGRAILPREDSVGSRVVVLSHDLWETRYGADPRIVGRRIRLDGDTYEVVGVMPDGCTVSSVWDAASRIELFTPFPPGVRTASRSSYAFPALGRLREPQEDQGARAGGPPAGAGYCRGAQPGARRAHRGRAPGAGPLHR